ncbi:DUF960 family protein [Bacillus cereus]
MTKKSRYMTKTISEELGIEVQAILWESYDDIKKQRNEQMDYLQVFEIEVLDDTLVITNRQEKPQLRTSFFIKNKIKLIKNTTVWIIDDTDYLTMMFPTDY